MAKDFFAFKRFTLYQDRCAMKVGTDGVLLGAWADLGGAETALDIGTGTGLLSLMLAQRFPRLALTALEIDPEAQRQASENCRRAPFANPLQILCVPLQAYQTHARFDAVVCNPPYFEAKPSAAPSPRSCARQQQSLSFEALLLHTNRLLQPRGSAFFIIPYPAEQKFLQTAARHHLFPYKCTRVQGSPRRKAVRSLLALSPDARRALTEDQLILEEARHVYTADFKALVSDFYLQL